MLTAQLFAISLSKVAEIKPKEKARGRFLLADFFTYTDIPRVYAQLSQNLVLIGLGFHGHRSYLHILLADCIIIS